MRVLALLVVAACGSQGAPKPQPQGGEDPRDTRGSYEGRRIAATCS